MSDTGSEALTLRCPACKQSFAVTLAKPAPKELAIVCESCNHRLSTDEILDAMASSLNDLLEQTRSRLSGGTTGKP
jgi:predicted Zn finger-like uncharacterized protein